MEMYNEIHVVFMPANTTSILQPMDQGLILVFKSYDLRNTSHMAMAPTGSDFSDETGKNKLKTFWKGITIVDAIMNIHDSWEEVKTPILTGDWERLVLTFTDDSEGLKTLVEDVTADVVETAGEREVEPQYVTALMLSHD